MSSLPRPQDTLHHQVRVQFIFIYKAKFVIPHSITIFTTYFVGESDLHFSKEAVHPTWYCYIMREKAPYADQINKL